MSRFTRSLASLAASAGKAFARYPAAMASALLIAASASWLVQSDAMTYDRTWQSLQLGFLLAAALGMAVTALGSSRSQRPLTLVLNLATLCVGAAVFLLIRGQGGSLPELTVARVAAAAASLLLVFLLLISRPETGSDYNQAAFMMLKAAMIALLYGLVILLGLTFTAFTVQSLLYRAMSEKVYQHIAIWSAFLGFTFFLGYFPDFARDVSDPHLQSAQKQPRFVEILFLYVLVPLMSVLSTVLLIWAGRILIVREWPLFGQLAGILSAYALAGIWLFIMVSRSEQPGARFFRRTFPPVLLVLLAFEAYALADRIRVQSVKPAEYWIMVVWLFALAAALLFLRGSARRSHITAVAGIVLLAVAVLPFAGYRDASVTAQSLRLQSALERNQMLVAERIQPAPAGLATAEKLAITDAAQFLLYAEGARLPAWFAQSITTQGDFARVFGFPPAYPDGSDQQPFPAEQTTYLNLPQGGFSISGYQLLMRPGDLFQGGALEIRGQRGLYSFSSSQEGRGDQPAITVRLDGKAFQTVDLRPFLDGLAAKYRGRTIKDGSGIAVDEMILRTSQGATRLMFVFAFIEIVAQDDGSNRYQYGLHSICIGEG